MSFFFFVWQPYLGHGVVKSQGRLHTKAVPFQYNHDSNKWLYGHFEKICSSSSETYSLCILSWNLKCGCSEFLWLELKGISWCHCTVKCLFRKYVYNVGRHGYIISLHNHHTYWSICSINTPNHRNWYQKSVSRLCNHVKTPCWTSALVLKWCFFKGPKRWRSLSVRLGL